MANTMIKFLRGAGMPTGRAFVEGNAGTLNYCEPWVNTTAKQMWIDNVCVNPHLAINSSDSTYLSLAYAQDSTTKEVTLTASLDEAAIASYVLGTGHDFLVKYMSSGENPTELSDTVYDINGNADGFIKIGSGLSYDPDTNTISAPVIESFLSAVEVVEGGTGTGQYSGGTAGHKYMHFTFTTQGTPAATEIYVDVTEFYDDTDTKTQISGANNDDVVVTLTSNSGTFTNNTTNTYSVTHKTITTTPTTDTATATNGGTISYIDSVTVANGHVTGYNTKTTTLPTSKSYDLTGDVNGTAVDGRKPEAQIKLTDDASTPNVDTVTIKHEAQTSGVGSMVMFKESSDNVLEMQITEIDGGTF